EQIGFLAAAVAYYGFVSIIPLLWLLLAIGTVVGLNLSEQALALLGQMISPAGEEALRSAFESDRATGAGR
ncbi:MAG: YihY/virulence factor BrkB family protein, partial [Halanaeroarchaeum sp.]